MTRPRFRIGTLMLLVVIAALSAALVDERRRFAAFRAEAQAEIAGARPMAERAAYYAQLAASTSLSPAQGRGGQASPSLRAGAGRLF
jgi:hypothetical protein